MEKIKLQPPDLEELKKLLKAMALNISDLNRTVGNQTFNIQEIREHIEDLEDDVLELQGEE